MNGRVYIYYIYRSRHIFCPGGIYFFHCITQAGGMKRRENLRSGVYLENGKQSMRQPIHFWKALSDLYNFDFLKNIRNVKFRSANKTSKKVSFVTLIVYQFF